MGAVDMLSQKWVDTCVFAERLTASNRSHSPKIITYLAFEVQLQTKWCALTMVHKLLSASGRVENKNC